MKRTLFSCCIWMTSLSLPLFFVQSVRADSGCESEVQTEERGDCVCPYSATEYYGECHWYYNHCDPAAEVNTSGPATVSQESTACEEAAARTAQTGDGEALAAESVDYWYDSESGTYHSYNFTEDAVVSEKTAEEALTDLFDFAEAEEVPADSSSPAEASVSDVVETSADVYGTDADAPAARYWDEQGDLDYSDESYIDEVFRTAESAEAEIAEEVADRSLPQVDQHNDDADGYGYGYGYDDGYDYDYGYGYDSYSEYETEYEYYGWDDEADSYCPADEIPAVETEELETVVESAVDVTDDATWQESIVQDPWQEEYDYAYDDEEYEYRYGKPYDYDAQVTDETEWDTAGEPADEQVADEAWEDEYYSDYEEYYDEYWEVETPADVPPAEVEDDVAAVDREESKTVHREAVMSLARTLDRFGSALQNLSHKLTDLVAEEVAEQPATETTQR